MSKYHVAISHRVNNGLGFEPLSAHMGGGVQHIGDFSTRRDVETACAPYFEQHGHGIEIGIYEGEHPAGYVVKSGKIVWL